MEHNPWCSHNYYHIPMAKSLSHIFKVFQK
nr:MAG TPA: hypothetical protein [Caudoviricetes sp.]